MNFVSNLLNVVFDLMGSLSFCVYSVLLTPFQLLQDVVARKNIVYLRFLLPRGLLCGFIRGHVEMRLGQIDSAITEFESLLGTIEEDIVEQLQKNPKNQVGCTVLDSIYTRLGRLYLEAGYLDEAFLLVVRVKKILGRDFLKGLPELNVKNAQLLQAALRAGKLIDEAGFATLFLQTGPLSEKINSEKARLKGELLKRKRLKNHQILKPTTEKTELVAEARQHRGKVLPFPLN